MKSWLIIGLLTAQLVVLVMCKMHLAEIEWHSSRVRGDIAQGFGNVTHEMQRQAK